MRLREWSTPNPLIDFALVLPRRLFVTEALLEFEVHFALPLELRPLDSCVDYAYLG